VGSGQNKKSLGLSAVSGMSWGLLGGAVGKLAASMAQIYAGWVLSTEDFALFAMASSCAAVLSGLVNGGTHRILVQRAQRYDDQSFAVLLLSFLFNLVVMAALTASAAPLARLFDAPALVPMLAVMGLSTLVSTPGHVLHAKLIGALKFGAVQGLAMCSHLIRHGSLVLFAFLGMGPLSFVLPLLVISVTDTLLAWRVVRRLPPRRPVSMPALLDVLKDSRWVMAGACAGALVQNGDNLAVSMFADKGTLGTYFFAFQLTFAFASLLGGTLQTVAMPMLAGISDNPGRQRQAVERAVGAASLASCGAATLIAVAASPVIHGLWAGKWDAAARAVQILSLAVPAVLVSWIGKSAIEARGGWPAATCLSMAEGAGTVAAAAGGAACGGLLTIAASVAAFKVFAGLAHVAAAARCFGGKVRPSLAPVLSSYAAMLGSLAVGRVIMPESMDSMGVGGVACTALATVAVFVLLSLVLCRFGVCELFGIARQILQRPLKDSRGCTT